MNTHDESPTGTAPPNTLRGDVRTARSRMRTKYGSQRQIVEVAALLTDDETLRFMAVASGPSQPDRHNHGLLALSDRRLLFVPKASGNDQVEIDPETVRALMWTKAGRTGTLTVLGESHSSSFTDVATADGRELMALVLQLFPHVKRLGHL